MPVWLSYPETLWVDHPEEIDLGEDGEEALEITVKSWPAGHVLSGAKVCLSGEDLYEVACTDIEGKYYYQLDRLVDIGIVVTLKGRLPYEGTCRVNPGMFSYSSKATALGNGRRLHSFGHDNDELSVVFPYQSEIVLGYSSSVGSSWDFEVVGGEGQYPTMPAPSSQDEMDKVVFASGDHLVISHRTGDHEWICDTLFTETSPLMGVSAPSVVQWTYPPWDVTFIAWVSTGAIQGSNPSRRYYLGKYMDGSFVYEVFDSVGGRGGRSGPKPPPPPPIVHYGDHGPSIDIDGEDLVHIAWKKNSEIYHTTYDPGGGWQQYPDTVSESPSVSSKDPSLSCASITRIVWEEVEGIEGRSEILHRSLMDDSWSDIDNISRSPEWPSRRAMVNGERVVWCELIDTDYEVYYSRFEDYQWTTPKNTSLTPSSASVYPQIAPRFERWFYVMWTEGSGPLYVVDFDLLYDPYDPGGGQSGDIAHEFLNTFELTQSFPNPFSEFTDISYTLPIFARVSLNIYNASGQLIRTLVEEEQQPCYYRIRWNRKTDSGRQAACGVYFYRIQAGDYTEIKKMIVLR